jgi:hypothetical protein
MQGGLQSKLESRLLRWYSQPHSRPLPTCSWSEKYVTKVEFTAEHLRGGGAFEGS